MTALFERSQLRALAILALAVFAAYGSSLKSNAFVYDDRYLIADNPFLHEGSAGIAHLLSTGYWQAIDGDDAKVQEYRPVLMLSFLAQTFITGFSARAMRLGNILLHLLVCLLLWEILRRKMGPDAALAGALVYAVMPIHAEAVGLLVGRSEVLSAVFLLSAWLALEEEAERGLALGLALYAAAVLTKESSVMFPLFMVANDWVFFHRKPWEKGSRASQSGLWLMTAMALTPRMMVLPAPFHGGTPYFQDGRLIAALTFARFSLTHYLWPSLTGTGLCTDYSRPLIPDSSPASIVAWPILLSVAALFAAAAWGIVKKRSSLGFWLLAPCLFLLPTSNLILPLDTLGAERFLYWPTIGLAAGWGFLYWKTKKIAPRLSHAGLICLCAVYALLLSERNRVWGSPLSFDRAAVACNPVSAPAWDGLGSDLTSEGQSAQGAADLERASSLNPNLADPYYNMARLEFSRGETTKARGLLRESLRRDPQSSDAWVLLGLCDEKKNRGAKAALSDFETGARLNPADALAQFDAGRLCLITSNFDCVRSYWKRYLRLAPENPQAPAVRAWLYRLNSGPRPQPGLAQERKAPGQ
ncbi:MAG TPA: glycosyltransferase family 39 protein [Elusimicrobiota bacterium]|nr:glycosyltransferase family 39 protein [Elusimicrobiota bacterium]